MPIIANCPECRKPMKLSDEATGRRVRCPACKHIFVAPAGEEEPEVIECDIAEEPAKRPSRDEDDDGRPRRKRRRDDEDDEDEDEDRRPRSSRSGRRKNDRDIDAPKKPLVYGIASCALFCAPVVGLALGGLAHQFANAALDELPRGRRAHAARKQLERAKLLGTIGSWVSLGWGIILLVIWALNGFRR